MVGSEFSQADLPGNSYYGHNIGSFQAITVHLNLTKRSTNRLYITSDNTI